MKIELVMQNKQNECGLCAIAMLASYYRFKKNIEFYRNLFKVGRDGMSIKNVCDILQYIRLNPSVHECLYLSKMSFDDKIPFILYQNNHFVLIEKIKNGYCYVKDPAVGNIKQSLEVLNQEGKIYIITVTKASDFMTENDKVYSYKNIIKMLYCIKFILFMAIITSIVVNLLQIVVPIILQNIIDSIILGDIKEQQKSIAISIIIISCIYILFTKIRNNILVEIQGRILKEISLFTMKHLLHLNYEFYDNRSIGDVLYRINILADIEKQISGCIISIVISVSSIFVLYIYFISMKNVFIIMAMTLLFVLVFIFVIYQNKMLLGRNKDMISSNQTLNETQTEIISQMYQIKCMNLIKYFLNKYKGKNEDYIYKFVCNQKGLSDFSMFTGLFEMFIPLLIIFIMIISGFNNKISVGTYFTLYIVIQIFTRYVMSISNTYVQIYTMRGSLYYINDMLNEEEEVKGIIHVKCFEQLSFEDVSFRYNENQEKILNHINFTILAGQKIAMVGTSGSGKTTIIKLLAKLYNCTSGEILINNKYKLQEIMQEDYSSLIGIVPQNSIMFNKSIRENLQLYDVNIDDEKIYKALEIVNMIETVKNMPMKLNTIISNANGNLSGGQNQRLGIARAILRKPRILILDESTSSLDTANEIAIHNKLKNLGMTLIVISHRLSTIQDAECIYFLKNGCIENQGSHKDLLSKSQCYRKLYEGQFKSSNEFVEI